jgi:CHRD domain
MNRPKEISSLAVLSTVIFCFAAPPAFADRVRARLDGFQEHPLALSTPATGSFKAKIDKRDQAIEFELSYSDINSGVTQAHIHFGQRFQLGGIAVFLCANGDFNPNPTNIPACPSNAGTVTGTLGPDSVIGPTGQGIAPGEFSELLEAIEEGVTYANVHSNAFLGGEIRGQIK